MGNKSSTPQSPDSDDSSPGSQNYSTAERVLDYGEHSMHQQARHERSFMERAESSLQGLMMFTGGNSPVVDIRRSDIVGEHQSSLGSSRPGSLPPSGPNRSHSVGSGAGGQASQGESAGSSIGSNTGLSHFLSNFNLWRSAVGPSSDRQRAQSLSHMPSDPAAQGGDSSGRSTSSRQHYHQHHSSDLAEDLSSLSLSNPRAALNRLLSSRNSSSGGASASSSGAVANLPTDSSRRDSNGTTNSSGSAAFSVRDWTFAAAQEFLSEATMNGLGLNRVYVTHSLPSQMWAVNGIKCPVCSKFVLPDDIECHLVMCLTKPRLNYNEDILTDDNKGECVICLEDLLKGHVIARLPCLCVYHKSCIDQWFDVNRSCPEHPSD